MALKLTYRVCRLVFTIRRTACEPILLIRLVNGQWVS